MGGRHTADASNDQQRFRAYQPYVAVRRGSAYQLRAADQGLGPDFQADHVAVRMDQPGLCLLAALVCAVSFVCRWLCLAVPLAGGDAGRRIRARSRLVFHSVRAILVEREGTGIRAVPMGDTA